MKITHKIGIAAVAGALTIGGAASAFAAGSNTSSTTGGDGVGGGKAAATAFVCAHLPEVQAQQQLHEQLLNGRITLLTEAKDAATAANHPKVVAKLDTRITTANATLAKLKDREAKVAAACAAPAPAPARDARLTQTSAGDRVGLDPVATHPRGGAGSPRPRPYRTVSDATQRPGRTSSEAVPDRQ